MTSDSVVHLQMMTQKDRSCSIAVCVFMETTVTTSLREHLTDQGWAQPKKTENKEGSGA